MSFYFEPLASPRRGWTEQLGTFDDVRQWALDNHASEFRDEGEEPLLFPLELLRCEREVSRHCAVEL